MRQGKEYWHPEIETMPREKMRELQGQRAIAIFNYAYENSPFYRRKFDAAGIKPGDIKTLEDFVEKVPFTYKSERIENQAEKPPFGDILAVPREKIVRIFLSPGPIYEPHTQEDIEWLADHMAKRIYMAGVRKGDIVQVTYSYHLMPAGLNYDYMLQKMGITTIPGGTGNTEIQVELMKKLGVIVYVGTPSFLAKMGEVAINAGLDPKKDLSLRLGCFGAEPLAPVRKRLEDTFGIECRDMYGVAEVGTIAGECPAGGGMHIDEDLFFLEIIDPKIGKQLSPGEEGEIVVTNLKEKTMPIIRYRIGDASIVNLEPCPCGRTAAKLTKIMGRVDALTKVRGVFIHPRQAEAVVKRHPELGSFQIIIDRPKTMDEMVIKVEYIMLIDKEAMKEQLSREFREALRIKTDVELVEKGTIPSGARPLVDKRVY